MKHPKNAMGLWGYLAVWTLCVLWFWLGLSGGGWIMAYTILTYGAILPLATLISAFLLEWKQNLGWRRWAAMGFFALMYAAAMWATFVLSTALSMTNLAPPSPIVFLGGLLPSAAGLAFGWLVRTGKLSPRIPLVLLLLLLCTAYVGLKTLSGPLLRFLPILDLPALILLLFGGVLWKKSKKTR